MLMNLITTFGQTTTCNSNFFGLKPWFYYLKTDGKCNVIQFRPLTPDGHSDFMLIGLVLVDDLLRIAGLVAIFYIIYGGFLYITSEGSPDQTQKAQNTIKNALLGLIIAVVSAGFVSYIGSRIG